MSNLYVDVHALQVLPPSCVNRDDTGSPKTAVYGGVTRARVSSQCWKNAVRKMFRESLSDGDIGKRTLHLSSLIKKEILILDPSKSEKDAEKLSLEILKNIGKEGIKMNSDDPTMNKTLFFISDAQVKAVADFAVRTKDIKSKESKDEMKRCFTDAPSIDIALFGRMVAEENKMKIDASCQVAHSISTHKVNNEYDYFTAQDDCRAEDNAGAGMLGTVEYNSSTLYRYATIAVHDLQKKLGDRTAESVKTFVDAFIRSMPTGKINTFANRTLPSAVMVTIREDQPINLVGAFEKPVKAGEDGYGYVENSSKALVKHAKATYENWLDAPAVSFVIGNGLEELGEKVKLSDMLAKLESEINSRL